MPPAVACFTFDNMAEAAEVGAGTRRGPRPDVADPSLTRGYPNLYRLLAAHDVRATFFVEGWNGIHHPDAVAEVVRRGHELGMHGWAHEPWHELDPAAEEALAGRATAALARAAGVRPVGFRAPGGSRTPHTEAVLRRLGYRYDASLGDGMAPAMLRPGLAQVPFVWSGVDGLHYLSDPPADPADVEEQWLEALGKVGGNGGLFVTVCHGEITGTADDRLAAFDAVVARAQKDGFDIVTVGEVAAQVLASEGRA